MIEAFDLSGRTALITGAGSETGIGIATARLLAQMGAEVILTSTTDRINDRAARLRAGPVGPGVVADLTDEQQVARLPEHVDVLVNNAGMVSIGTDFESGRLTEMTLDTWRAGIQRNLDTAFLVSRHVLPAMTEQRWGRVVNVTSVTGPVMAMRDEPAYATAKAGMMGLTRSMALDFADSGITVNAVAPGWIATGSQTVDEARQALMTPAGRAGEPDDGGRDRVVLRPRGRHTTAQCLVVDGGNSIAEERA